MLTTHDVIVRERVDRSSRAEWTRKLRAVANPQKGGWRPLDLREYRDRFLRDHPLGDRALSHVMDDGAWRGERCFLVGGGPSLVGFDFNRLRNKGRIIAVNKSFVDVPFADIVFFMDISFYRAVTMGKMGYEAQTTFNGFGGYRVFLDIAHRMPARVYCISPRGKAGYPDSLKTGLFYSNNSGYGALQLALVLGASPIYLLGYDAKHGNGRSHYHGGYEFGHQTEHQADSFRLGFERIAADIISHGVRVVNLNPDSAIKCFEFGDVNEVLGNGT